VVLYPDAQVKLEKQLKYANKRGIEEVYILGPEEVANKTVKIKNMKTGEQQIVSL
jgi:histidyl-tRNA synthetase